MPHKLINDIQLSFRKSILKDVSGWIFTNFHHRDTLTDFLLKIDSESVSTRRWIYIVKDFGNPIKILHKIEKEALSHLPGDEYFYSSQEELVEILSLHCKNKTYAILKDKNIPVISTVDGGFVELLAENQIKTVCVFVIYCSKIVIRQMSRLFTAFIDTCCAFYLVAG